jgi:hypothetical protein
MLINNLINQRRHDSSNKDLDLQLAATLPRYAKVGTYPVSDTYPIPIRIGYTLDMYQRSIRKKINQL